MEIGQRINARRKELKMSADELAKRLGKDRSTIYRYEKGDIENLPLDILEPIAEALETTPAYLMGWQKQIEEKPVEKVVESANKLADLFMRIEFNDDEDLSFMTMIEEYTQLPDPKKAQVREYVHLLAGKD